MPKMPKMPKVPKMPKIIDGVHLIKDSPLKIKHKRTKQFSSFYGKQSNFNIVWFTNECFT